MNLKLIFPALFSLLLMPALHAQKPKEERLLSIRCLTFQLNDSLSEIFVHSPGAEEPVAGIPVTPKTYLNHERVVLPLYSNRLVFTTEPSAASTKDPEKVIGTTTVPANLKTAIFMFFPADKKAKGKKLNILTFDDSKKAFPPGSLSVVNLCPLPLLLQLEDKKFGFNPGQRKVIEDPPKNERYSIGMRAFVRQNDDWKRIGASQWPYPGKKRVIKIAFYNPNTKQIEIDGVRDISIP